MSRVRSILSGIWPAVALIPVAGVVGLLAPTPQPAEAQVPQCGGNSTVRQAPYTCTETKTIDGTAITVVLNVNTSGLATIVYRFGTPRNVPTPLRARWHENISSNTLAVETSGVAPAGQVGPFTRTLQWAPTDPDVEYCGGQLDMKAVFTDNGDARGRVSAPLVGLDICATAPTTVATTSPTTATVASTAPGTPTTAPQSSAVTAPQSQPGVPGAASSASTLPSTGYNWVEMVFWALVIAALGYFLVLIARHTRRRDA